MTKAVSASEAKNRLGSVVSWVLENEDEVIVENHGEPKVVIMSFTEYQKVKKLKEQERHRQALERLERVRERVRARNQDITTEDQAIEIADQFSREIINSLSEKGKIKLESE